MAATILTAAAAVLVINIPFGCWRAGTKKFSLPWFLAIHLPIPLVAGIRFLSGLGWQWATFPVFLGAYFAGQYVGGRLGRFLQRTPEGKK